MSTHLDSSETERALREALAARARQVRPSGRLDAILQEASAPARDEGGRRGPTILAVAAAAAVVAGMVWTARPATEDATLPAGPPSSAAVATPPPSGPAPSPSAPGRPSPSVALAVYWVGDNGGEDARPGLVRTFAAVDADATGSSAERVRAAVGESLRRSERWRGTTVQDARVSASRITVRLSSPGEDAPSADAADLEVAALVWTAQAALGRGDVPVRVVADGGGRLLGHVATGASFTRAATPAEALTDLWIDEPAPDARLRADQPVTVRGQAVAFEATVEWELSRGTTVVREGFATADAGAPRRGTFTVDLGRLAPGGWTFRVFTTSAQDGERLVAERLVSFSVDS